MIEERVATRFRGGPRRRKPKEKGIDPKIVAVCRAMDAGATLTGPRVDPQLQFNGERLNYAVPFFKMVYDGFIVSKHPTFRWFVRLEDAILSEKGIALARESK